MTYPTVVAGTDGSDSSYRAVRRAAEVARDAGATLLLVCAYRPLPADQQRRLGDQLGDEAYKVVGSAPAEGVLAEAEGRARQAGAEKVQTRAVESDPVDALLAAARDHADGLLVVGNRGLNSLAGRLLGSVPSHVVHRAPCDVLIVHTAER